MSLGPAVLQPQLFLGEAGRRNSVEGSNAPLVEHVGFSVLQAVMYLVYRGLYALCSWAGVLKWRPRLQGNVCILRCSGPWACAVVCGWPRVM